MGFVEKLGLWRTRKIIWKWATYYILAMKDKRNSSTTKRSCVQQIFILLLLTKFMSNQEVNSSYHYRKFSFHLQARLKFKSSGQFNISAADFHKRFRVSINKFYRVIDSHLTLERFLFIECEENKQQEHIDFWLHHKMHYEIRWQNIKKAWNRIWNGDSIEGHFLLSS